MSETKGTPAAGGVKCTSQCWRVTGETLGGKLVGVSWHNTFGDAKREGERWRWSGLYYRIERERA